MIAATQDIPPAENLHEDFGQLHNRYRTELGILYTRPYLVVIGRRKG